MENSGKKLCKAIIYSSTIESKMPIVIKKNHIKIDALVMNADPKSKADSSFAVHIKCMDFPFVFFCFHFFFHQATVLKPSQSIEVEWISKFQLVDGIHLSFRRCCCKPFDLFKQNVEILFVQYHIFGIYNTFDGKESEFE